MISIQTPVELQAHRVLQKYSMQQHKFDVTMAGSQNPLIWQKSSSFVGLYFSYTLSLYSGCQFGCSYCYVPEVLRGLPSKLGGWGNYVKIRPRGVLLLEKYRDELAGSTIFMSATTDPYQWVERDFELTRRTLEMLAEMDFSYLLISTRSTLILRDLDILTDKRLRGRVEVGISISSDIPSVREQLEPRTPLYRKRFEVAKTLREHGIPVRIHAAPLGRHSDNFFSTIGDCADWAWFDGADYGASKQAREAQKLYGRKEGEGYADAARLQLGEGKVGFGREQFGWVWDAEKKLIVPLPRREGLITPPKRRKESVHVNQ